MTQQTHLPERVEVIPRRVRFDLDAVPKYWHSNSPFLTHYFTGLSTMFPEGERFFIDSVRHFEDEIDDPIIGAEVRAFIRQEAQHGHQHELYNAWAERHGIPAHRLEALNRKFIAWASRIFPPKTQLAITIALEHFTAILANQMLTKPKLSEGMHPDMRPLWLWHAAEETEHKAVCYDAYLAVDGGEFRRRFVMTRVMFGFQLGMLISTFYLLSKDGWKILDLGDIARGMRLLYGKGGFLRSVFPELRAYLRRGFHPWDCDNRELIDTWARENAEYVV